MEREIAERIDRSEDGIRNIRHRMKLKTETKESLRSLFHERDTLRKSVAQLRLELFSLQSRREDLTKIQKTEEEVLNKRLHNALLRLKDHKAELFTITIQEQLAKITVQLTGDFIKWLLEG